MPKYTKSKPATTFVAIYAKANSGWSLRSIMRVSLEKVEKVVKPPHRPTVNSKLTCLLIPGNRIGIALKNPMRKQPTRFTHNVARGMRPSCQGNSRPMP